MRLSYFFAIVFGLAFIVGMYAIVLTQPTFMQYENTNKVDDNIDVVVDNPLINDKDDSSVIGSSANICDALNPCTPNTGDCYVFEGETKAVCYLGDPCETCNSGECLVLESYPMQVRCL